MAGATGLAEGALEALENAPPLALGGNLSDHAVELPERLARDGRVLVTSIRRGIESPAQFELQDLRSPTTVQDASNGAWDEPPD